MTATSGDWTSAITTMTTETTTSSFVTRMAIFLSAVIFIMFANKIMRAVGVESFWDQFYFNRKKKSEEKPIHTNGDDKNSELAKFSGYPKTKPFEELPTLPDCHWLFGHLATVRHIFRNASTWKHTERLARHCNEYGQAGLWLGPPPSGPCSFLVTGSRGILITHAEDAKTILRAEYYRQAPNVVGNVLSKHMRMFLGAKNLAMMQGRDWKVHRSAIHRSVAPISVLRHAQRPMLDVAETLSMSLKCRILSSPSSPSPNEGGISKGNQYATTSHGECNNNIIIDQDSGSTTSDADADADADTTGDTTGKLKINTEQLMKMITIDVFCKTALSVDLRCCQNLSPSPIATAFDYLSDELSQRMTNPVQPSNYFYWLPTRRNKRHRRERTLLRSFLSNLISQRKKEQGERGQEETKGRNLSDNVATATPTRTTTTSEKQDLLSNILRVHQEYENSKKEEYAAQTTAAAVSSLGRGSTRGYTSSTMSTNSSLRSSFSTASVSSLSPRPGTGHDVGNSNNQNKQGTETPNGASRSSTMTATSEALDDVLLTLLFAGYDTTSITLTYALYLIATHPIVEQRCLEEIKSFLPSTPSFSSGTNQTNDGDDEHVGNDRTAADSDDNENLSVENLTYCKAVLLETLRLYPVGGLNTRYLRKPVQLRNGFIVPKDTRVLLMTEIIQRMERHFPSPHRFWPERWVTRRRQTTTSTTTASTTTPINENDKSISTNENKNKNHDEFLTTHRWIDRFDEDVVPSTATAEEQDRAPAANRDAFLAFSQGGRSCPGRKFAMQEATLVLSVLLREFKFSTVPGYKLKPIRKGIVQHPHDGIPMMIQIREEKKPTTKQEKYNLEKTRSEGEKHKDLIQYT